MLMGEAPDVIVLGGDYVTWGDRDYVRAAAEALGPLSAPFGVFGILGNHDDDHDMPAALAARGVQMLKDARTAITPTRIMLWIDGLGRCENVFLVISEDMDSLPPRSKICALDVLHSSSHRKVVNALRGQIVRPPFQDIQ